MPELTFQELTSFLATPEAQALSTDDEKIAAAQAWKAKLEQANTPAEPEFNAAEHIAYLTREREDWAKSGHPEAVKAERLAFYDGEIQKYESQLSTTK